MSKDPVTKNEIRFIQNDMLCDVKKLEDTLSNKLYNVTEQLSNKENEYNTKFTKVSDNINELLSLIVKRKLDNEKIEELLNMKSKIEEQLMENKTKLTMLSRNLDNALYKYDRIILDNLEVPGIIGAGCKYRNCKSFFENIFEELKSVHVFKEAQFGIQNNYKEKFDTLNKKIDVVTTESNEKFKQTISIKMEEFKAMLDNRYKDIEDLLQQTLSEKVKYIDDLTANLNQRNLEYEKIENLKFEIIDRFETEMKKFNKIIDDNKKNYEKQIEEYKELKKKVDKLMDNMKTDKSNKNFEYPKPEKSAYINRSRPKKNNLIESLSNKNLINVSSTINKSNRNDIKKKNAGNTFITTQNEETKLPLIPIEKNNIDKRKNTENIDNNKSVSSKLNKKMSAISLKKKIKNDDLKTNSINKSNDFSQENLLTKTNLNTFSPNKNFTTRNGNNPNIFTNKIKTKIEILNKSNSQINTEKKEKLKVKSFVKEKSYYSDTSSLSSNSKDETKTKKKQEKLNQKLMEEISKTQYKERDEVANKLKLCSVDYMTHKKELTIELSQNPINLKNCLAKEKLHKDKNNRINTPNKNVSSKKNSFNMENNDKNKSNIKNSTKTVYGNSLFPSRSKFMNKNNLTIENENLQKTPNLQNFPDKNSKNDINNINSDKKINDISNNINNNENYLTLQPRNATPPIKVTESLKSVNDKKLMDIDNSKNINERIINDKITLLKNNTDILNIRINTLEEKYMPLLQQVNDTLSRMNEIYDEIRKKNGQIKVLTPKNINPNKIIMQESLEQVSQKKIDNSKKSNIKLNNTLYGINLNYPKTKNVKEKEKDRGKDKEIIYDEIQIRERKPSIEAPNKVLKRVEPFLIKFLKNGK